MLAEPSAEERQDSGRDENDFLQVEEERLKQHKEDLKNRSRADALGRVSLQCPVAVIHPDVEPSAILRWQRSWHQELHYYQLEVADARSEAEFWSRLRASIEATVEPFVIFNHPSVRCDESVLAAALDFLHEDEGFRSQGVVFGAWVEKGGDVQAECFTERVFASDGATFRQAVSDVKLRPREESLLSLGVFRKLFLLDHLNDWTDASENKDSSYDRVVALLNRVELHRIGVPLARITL
ncbi:MAG: hypothetical protein ACOYOF_10505 [Verrucomicrobiaceae bacterium]